MALEFHAESNADMPLEEMIGFLGTTLGCERVDELFYRRTGLHLMASIVEAEDAAGFEELLGDGDLLSVTFRLVHTDNDDDAQRNFIDLVNAVIGFMTSFPAAGVLLEYNGERIILQRLTGGAITFDDEWWRYAPDGDDPALAEVSAGHGGYRLPQPRM